MTKGFTYAPIHSNSAADYRIARDEGAITHVMDSKTCVPT